MTSIMSVEMPNQYLPAVAYVEISKNFIVVWGDERNLGTTGTDIYGRLVSGAGALLGSDFLISSGDRDQTGPRTACSAQVDECLVLWQDRRNAADGGTDIWGQRVGGDGSLKGPNFPVVEDKGEQHRPAIALDDASGRYLVAWHDDNGVPGGYYDIRGRLVTAGGTLAGDSFAIASASLDQVRPAVAFNSNQKEFEVVWYDMRGGVNAEIYGQRLAEDGSLSGGNILLMTGPDNQYSPSIAYDPVNNEYRMIWYSIPNGAEVTTMRIMTISPLGNALGDQAVFCNTGWFPTLPAMVYNSNAREFLATWDDGRSYNVTGVDIYGQRLASKAASPTPGPTATPTAIAPPGQGAYIIMLPFLPKQMP